MISEEYIQKLIILPSICNEQILKNLKFLNKDYENNRGNESVFILGGTSIMLMYRFIFTGINNYSFIVNYGKNIENEYNHQINIENKSFQYFINKIMNIYKELLQISLKMSFQIRLYITFSYIQNTIIFITMTPGKLPILRNNNFNHIITYSTNYANWYSRKNYISLIEGCSEYNSHIVNYLFNDMVCREICTFLDDEHLPIYEKNKNILNTTIENTLFSEVSTKENTLFSEVSTKENTLFSLFRMVGITLKHIYK